MDSSLVTPRRTRRQFLSDAIRLSAGAAALVALGPRSAPRAFAQGRPSEMVKVLVEDLVQATAADFARGRARGVEIAAETGNAVLRGRRGAEFESAASSIPFQATHLGVHWVVRDAPPEALQVDVRTSGDGSTWSDWLQLSIEAVEELPAGLEVFSALADGQLGRFVQYRLRFGADQVATVERVTVTAINPVDGPREPLATAAATSATLTAADGSTVRVTTREGWGCDESLRFRRKAELWPEMYVPARKVVLHHTATSNSYADGAAEVRAIYTYHARTLGWGDIGYHSLIDKAGNVYEGRHGRGEGSDREILSADIVAGHVLGHNYGSTGIAVIGNYNDLQPSTTVLDRVEDLMTLECGRHQVNPQAASDFLRSDNQWHAGLANISGHNDSYATDCPGTNLKSKLDGLRSGVATRLGGGAAPALASTSPRAQQEPGTLSFSFAAPCRYSLEGWYKPSNSDDIAYLTGYEAAGYGDSLAKRLVWTSNGSGEATFSGLAAGQYTMHVRAESGRYEANLSFAVEKTSAPSKPPRPPRK